MSRNFDGVNDIIAANGTNLDDLASFLWCAWLFPTSAGEVAGRIAVKGAGTERKAFLVESPAPDGKITCSIITSGSQRSAMASSGTINPYSQWCFVAVSYLSADGGPRLWKGTLQSVVAETSYLSRTDGTGTNITEAGEDLKIGNRNATDRTFAGRIAHLSIWSLSGTPTAAQLDRLRMSTDHAALAAEIGHTCVGYWRMAESETANDLSGNNYHGTITGATAAIDPPLAAMREVVAYGIPHTLRAA